MPANTRFLLDIAEDRGVTPKGRAVLREILTRYGNGLFRPGAGDIKAAPVASVTRRLTELQRAGFVFHRAREDTGLTRWRFVGFDRYRVDIEPGGKCSLYPMVDAIEELPTALVRAA